MSDIDRYTMVFGHSGRPDTHEDVVKFSDHERSLASQRTEIIEEMVKPLMGELSGILPILDRFLSEKGGIVGCREGDLCPPCKAQEVLAAVEKKIKEQP